MADRLRSLRTRAARLPGLPVAVIVLSSLLAGCGGGASTETLPQSAPGTQQQTYSGPAPATADVQAFMVELWTNLQPAGPAGCGNCHSQAGGQAPMFARSDDVNLAYQAANPLADRGQPELSRLVTKVGGGHNCWLGSDQACADIMATWISNWVGGSGSGGRQILLTPPPLMDPGQSKNFPPPVPAAFGQLHALLTQYCSACHSNGAGTPQSPFFADADPAVAYEAAKPKIDLDDPANSRFVLRLGQEFHNCWSDCAANAATMQAAIQAFADSILPTSVDPALVISKALRLIDGTVASGGNRFENNQIALWEFKAGQGSTAFDTSGVSPAMDLTLSGTVNWVGGWGIEIVNGKAQASTTTSRKLYDRITLTGEYSIEAWVAPANVVQEDTRIVSYSAGTLARNFNLGQTQYSYDFFNRSGSTDGNGAPALSTAAADEDLQATLQHVVATYDPVNGRRIYVNGVFTDDVDPVPGDTLADWDETFAFVLGNEVSGDRQWQGVIRLVAIHDRALSEAQIQQNYAVGVGEKFFLLFFIGDLINVPDAYILFEVSQFDNYSYLFNAPVFLSLDPAASVSGVRLAGMRIGLNGQLLNVGQAYANLDLTLNDATGQPLSPIGTVVPLQKGPDADEFFLSFDELGGNFGPVTPPANLTPPPELLAGPQPDIGLRSFDEINATMSAVTSVPVTEVQATYELVRQQLPASENAGSFSSAQEIGIAQLAIAYCNALIENDPARRDAYFPNFVLPPTGVSRFTLIPSAAFAGPARDDLINPLVDRIMGVGLIGSQPAFADVVDELGYAAAGGNPPRPANLIDRLIASDDSSPQRTEDIAKAVCSALLGSGVALVQ
ncbi:MAG: LamG domain-containing protein [Gammaproteobacteria bacterium]|nr:MAG: LamG domain-containing protein [Gammaproteobacteria bacterium]